MSTADLIAIASLVLIEWILSIDNAACLATMVKHLNPVDQQKALKYGIIGAYLFRGIALFIASWLIQFAFLKLLGWLYLIYLAYSFFMSKNKDEEQKVTVGRSFWMTVASVEVMDMVFSIDNVFAAVAMSPKLWVVMTGVFIGILAMRFVAGRFVILMNKYPELENSAYIVIAMLGMKLCLFIDWHTASIVTSILTIIIFSYPFIKKYVQHT